MVPLEKSSFILYTEYAEEIAILSDQEAGAFIKAVFAHESGQEEPDLTGGARLLFSIVRRRLDENREKYRATCEKRSKAGQKGGLASAGQKQAGKPKQTQANASFACPEESRERQNQPDTEPELEPELEPDPDPEPEKEGKGKKGRSDAAAASAGRAKSFPHEEEAYRSAVYLDEQIRTRLPTQRPAGEKCLQRWADAFDKCRRVDGHGWEEIREVLRFSQTDPFWSENILSGGKFREKYVQLLAKMRGARAAPTGRSPGSTIRDLQTLYQEFEEEEL